MTWISRNSFKIRKKSRAFEWLAKSSEFGKFSSQHWKWSSIFSEPSNTASKLMHLIMVSILLLNSLILNALTSLTVFALSLIGSKLYYQLNRINFITLLSGQRCDGIFELRLATDFSKTPIWKKDPLLSVKFQKWHVCLPDQCSGQWPREQAKYRLLNLIKQSHIWTM